MTRALHIVSLCDRARRPAVAVDFDDAAAWDRPCLTDSVTREGEQAKREFCCSTHGRIGAALNVVIRTFGTAHA